jgi:hypothetical protein
MAYDHQEVAMLGMNLLILIIYGISRADQLHINLTNIAFVMKNLCD